MGLYDLKGGSTGPRFCLLSFSLDRKKYNWLQQPSLQIALPSIFCVDLMEPTNIILVTRQLVKIKITRRDNLLTGEGLENGSET